jgi:hypothetical protein
MALAERAWVDAAGAAVMVKQRGTDASGVPANVASGVPLETHDAVLMERPGDVVDHRRPIAELFCPPILGGFRRRGATGS